MKSEFQLGAFLCAFIFRRFNFEAFYLVFLTPQRAKAYLRNFDKLLSQLILVGVQRCTSDYVHGSFGDFERSILQHSAAF